MKRVIVLVVAIVATLGLTAPPATAVPGWETTATTWTNPAARHPRVVDLRYAQHPRFDRVVIRFAGRIPGYRATYHRRFFHDASGLPVPIRGGLQVVLVPAYAHNGAGADVYRGPRLVRPGFPALKGIAMTGDFEGQVSFAFGLRPRRAPYRIFRLDDPQRLVIDFKHT
ncbi:hypothetical protein GCM10009798_15760 [Nocardioides panacihumi]|uniref:AMIN-like domain-containing protein n=1 Tax=Nocardioides panacihumi TaxID=400774 RepID=A0ABN2QRP5_9ACTN